MDEENLKEQLAKEGFDHIVVWEDKAGAEYPNHTHERLTVHVILQGEMTLNDGKQTNILKSDDRFDIPAGTVHSAKIGPQGCKYLIGEK